MNKDLLWDIRAFVYQHFAETTRAPRMEDAASCFSITEEEAKAAYEELNRRHALYLEPGTRNIVMAWPFSGVETPFKVHANGKIYFANCAWDSLGIPAALHADAEIEATCAQSGKPIHLMVSGQKIRAADALVHFLLPFREWYNDLTFT